MTQASLIQGTECDPVGVLCLTLSWSSSVAGKGVGLLEAYSDVPIRA
jgi:hypothetical protein